MISNGFSSKLLSIKSSYYCQLWTEKKKIELKKITKFWLENQEISPVSLQILQRKLT